jgi:hypothetical protein
MLEVLVQMLVWIEMLWAIAHELGTARRSPKSRGSRASWVRAWPIGRCQGSSDAERSGRFTSGCKDARPQGRAVAAHNRHRDQPRGAERGLGERNCDRRRPPQLFLCRSVH